MPFYIYSHFIFQYINKLEWRYWETEDREIGPWTKYSPMCSQTLTRAFYSGKSEINITSARQKYLINFVSMTQENIETGAISFITVTGHLNAGVHINEAFSMVIQF